MKFEIALVVLLSLASVAVAGCSIVMYPEAKCTDVVMIDHINSDNVTKYVPEQRQVQCTQPE